MATLLNTNKKLVKIKTNGPIRVLGGITGPILYPCRIDMRKIVNMVQQGVVVYEVNPKNQAEEVRLTIQNVQKDNFPDAPAFTNVPEPKKPVALATVKDEEVVKAKQDNILPDETEKKSDALTEAVKPVETEAPKYKENNSGNNHKNDFNKKH